jgi:glutamyl-tRNA reductase
VAPAIVALRTRTREVLQAEVDRTLGTRLKHLSEADRAALGSLVDAATNKLLHAPTTRLRQAAGSTDGADFVRAVTHLFELPEPAPSAPANPAVPDDEGRVRH